MKRKEFLPKLEEFVEKLRGTVREQSPNAQVTSKEASPTNIWMITIMEEYYQEHYLVWCGDKGPMWSYYG